MLNLFSDWKNYIIVALFAWASAYTTKYYLTNNKYMACAIAQSNSLAVQKNEQEDMDKLQAKLKQEKRLLDEQTKRRLNEPLSEDCDENKDYMLKSALNFKENN